MRMRLSSILLVVFTYLSVIKAERSSFTRFLQSKLRWNRQNPQKSTFYRSEPEEEPEKEIIRKSTTVAAVSHPSISSSTSSFLGSLLTRKMMVRLALSGLQVGLIAYLGYAVVTSFAEVLFNEYQQHVPKDQISDILEFLEQQDQTTIQQALKDATTTTRIPNHNLVLLQLAQRLLATGIPLRTATAAGGRSSSSVESLLNSLTRTETQLLQQCLWIPSSNETTKLSPAGLGHIQQSILATVSNHNSQSSKFASLFDHSSSGVLLYGPPGCGKTFLVKTMAQATKLPCLVVTPSVLLRKYVGETNSQVRTLFSLATKLSPCVLCIDELDGLFRERSESEHEVSRDLKTEFLQWMDGMLSSSNQKVIIVGATNRPFDVDSAVLRRLPQSFFVGLPEASTRLAILQNSLEGVPTDATMDFNQIVSRTEGYSPSDIRQLLQTAALSGPIQSGRPMTNEDIQRAFMSVPPTPLSPQYRNALLNFRRQMQGGAVPVHHHHEGGIPVMQTPHGNFYSLGTINLDHDTFDALEKLIDKYEDSDSDEEL